MVQARSTLMTTVDPLGATREVLRRSTGKFGLDSHFSGQLRYNEG